MFPRRVPEPRAQPAPKHVCLLPGPARENREDLVTEKATHGDQIKPHGAQDKSEEG